jgi:uncharacterized protein YkwD
MTPRRTALTRIALVAALMTGLSTVAIAPAGAATLSPRAKMYRATNSSRLNHEIRRVDIQDRISRLARQHSIAMANRGAIFHTSTSVINNSYLDGVNWSWWGENVGVGGSISSLQQAFMQSDDHRANILDRHFRRVAVGTYRDENGYLWVTVFFYG